MPLIETTRHGDIHVLRMARPPVNALDPALCRALVLDIILSLLEDSQDDVSLRAAHTGAMRPTSITPMGRL